MCPAIAFCQHGTLEVLFGKKPRASHLNDSILSLDPRFHTILRNLDIQILALEVARDLNRNFQVGDCLRPFVGQLALLFLLFGFGGLVEALALRGRG